ncbi:MAG: enoyl-CoA hydratase [Proteobacteria bacterium]|nr:enoyl-CoA hydratase [Pseudomonadota bacterium]
MSAELQASRRDATLILTFSNPGTQNTLHPDLCAAAVEVFTTAERDDSVRAVVLTGGKSTFCAGIDLHRLLEMRTRDADTPGVLIDHLHSWIEAIRNCPKPVIAAVEGIAAGAGFSLALACDLIVAGNSARFAMPASRIGLTPEGSGAWFLLQALPRQLATEILLEGKPVTATHLHALGLVNKLAADGMTLDSALDWADDLASLAPNALEQIKSLIDTASDNTLSRHAEQEKQVFIETLHHHNAHEGIQAFLQKRPPEFT